MKYLLVLPFVLLSFHILSQEILETIETPSARLIMQTGIGLQGFSDVYKMSTFSVERPLGNFWHLGLQHNLYFNDPLKYFYGPEVLGGFETGGFVKYFLHGRFSGRKSGFYLGPELRFGTRRFQIRENGIFPPPSTESYRTYNEKISKLLMRWGVQWQFGRAILEVSAPFGFEFYKITSSSTLSGSQNRFLMLPTLQLGLAI